MIPAPLSPEAAAQAIAKQEHAAAAPSPFLSGTNLQFAWDSTSLGLLKECPRKYFYTIIEGWRSKSESVHLTFGIWFHKGLELYDKFKALGSTHDEATLETLEWLMGETWVYAWVAEPSIEGREVLKELPGNDETGTCPLYQVSVGPWEPETPHPNKSRETLVRSVLWYLEEYKADPAKTLILANGAPAVELSFRFESGLTAPDGTPYMLSGHMDRMVEYAGDNFVMDRKTTGTSPGAYYFSNFNPDNQMTLYTIAGKVVYDIPVSGVIIDAAQIAVGFTSFARGMTMRTASQLDEWMDGLQQHLAIAEGMALSPLSAVERGWPMNEKSCGAYGGCVFRKVCSVDRAVRKNYLMTNFEVRRWNPLETR